VYVLEKMNVVQNAPVTFIVARNAETLDVNKVVLNQDVQIKPLCWASVCDVAHTGRRNYCEKVQTVFVTP
jgi:hypothetical protein